MMTPELLTERLFLRPFREEDLEDVFYGWETDPDVARYMMWESHNDKERTKLWLSEEIDNIPRDDWYRWAVLKKDSHKLLGTCLIYFNDEETSYVVGYNLSKKYWGKGYTTEAMKRIMEFARDGLELSSITGSHSVENPASGKVMEKLGMAYYEDCDYVCNGGRIKTKGRSYKMMF